MECNIPHPKTKHERLLTGVHVCEQTWRAPRSPTDKVWHLTEIFLSRRKVQNLHHLGVSSSSTSTQGTEANREDVKLFLFWPHLSTHSLTLCNRNVHKGGVMITSISRTKKKLRSQILSHLPSTLLTLFPRSGFLLFLLFLFFELFLPPGEEGSSALETLCVGLTVGSLGCSGCFDDYRGHLDQLQGCFTVLQGLAQVQDLEIIKEKEKACQNKNTCMLNSWKRSFRSPFFQGQTLYVLSKYSNSFRF